MVNDFVETTISATMNRTDNKDLKMLNEALAEKDEVTESSLLNLENGKPVKKKEKTRRSFVEKLRKFKANTTVEPIVACYIMPSILASLGVQNLNLEKACRVNLNFSDEICTALNNRQTENYTIYEEQVQTLVASLQAWKNIIQTVIPITIILFVGAWSDKTGRRKACILMPVIGELLSSIGYIINTYFFYELPVEVTVITESIFPAITGGWFTNFIGVFSYIGDITTIEDRTYRVGIVNIIMTVGSPVASALSGVLLRWTGYYGIFLVTTSLFVFSLTYGLFFLEEPKKKNINEKNQGCFGSIKQFFDIGLIVETFKVAFKKGSGKRRLRVCLLFFGVFTIFGPIQGEMSIMYLFTRYRFNWDEVQFSLWSAYSTVTNLIGTTFSISFFSNYLKLDDPLVGIISNSSKLVAAFAYAFARNDLEIYLAPLLDILNGAAYIALRSIASKLVSGDEFGKLNSLYAFAEALTPLLFGPLYTQVYVAAINVLPGAVFLLGAGLTVPSIFIFGWLYFEHRKDKIRKNADLKCVKLADKPPI